MHELGRLFAVLQCAPLSVGDPSGVARSLSVSGETQEDMTELMTLLLTAIESELSKSTKFQGTGNLVELFRGEIENGIVCSECHNRTSRLESFQELRVQPPAKVAISPAPSFLVPAASRSPKIPRKNAEIPPTVGRRPLATLSTGHSRQNSKREVAVQARLKAVASVAEEIRPDAEPVVAIPTESPSEIINGSSPNEVVVEVSHEMPTESPKSGASPAKARLTRKRPLTVDVTAATSRARRKSPHNVVVINAGSSSGYYTCESPSCPSSGLHTASHPASANVDRMVELEKMLHTLFKSEVLRRDNQYYCEKCDKRVDAVKTQSIARLPEVGFTFWQADASAILLSAVFADLFRALPI